MISSKLKTTLLTSLTAGVVMAAVEAQAGGFAIREQSAVGQGTSFAGEGTPGMGLSAMFWNPAAVTQAKGMQSESHISIIMPSSTLTEGPGTSPALQALTPAGTSRDIGETGFVPSSYSAYQLNPSWYLGVAITAPYGLTTDSRGVPWAAQQLAMRASIRSIDANPVLGWKINDMVSVAAGPRVLWVQARLSRSLFALPPFLSFNSPVSLETDDIGFGFTAGITVTPTPWTEIALGYRSQVKLNLDGQTIFVPNPVLALALPVFNANPVLGVTSSETLPDQINLGIRQRISETFTLLGTVEWTHWSVLQTVPFTFTTGPVAGATATTINFNFRDGWFFALGGEYDWDASTKLRAGIAYEISPVTDQFRDVALPDRNRWWASFGLTRKITDRCILDFGYSYIWGGDAPINVGPGHPDQPNLVTATPGLFNTFQGVGTGHVQIVSVSLRYRLQPEVVVTKY